MDTGTIQSFVAAKGFAMGGHMYSPGDPIDVSHLPEHKVGQLLNQRFIRPMTPESPQTE